MFARKHTAIIAAIIKIKLIKIFLFDVFIIESPFFKSIEIS
mgnify:CR=1 FL=1